MSARPDPSAEPGREVELLKPYLKNPEQAPDVAHRVLSISGSYRGPIPPPEYLRGFEEAVPGSPRLIIEMAREAQRHRHRLDRQEMAYCFLGLVLGALLAALCVGGAIGLAVAGKPELGRYLVGVPVLGVAGWFARVRLGKG